TRRGNAVYPGAGFRLLRRFAHRPAFLARFRYGGVDARLVHRAGAVVFLGPYGPLWAGVPTSPGGLAADPFADRVVAAAAANPADCAVRVFRGGCAPYTARLGVAGDDGHPHHRAV